MVSLIYSNYTRVTHAFVSAHNKVYKCTDILVDLGLAIRSTASLLLQKATYGLKYLGGFEKLSTGILNILKNKTKIISFRQSGARADRDVFIIRVYAEKPEKEHQAT